MHLMFNRSNMKMVQIPFLLTPYTGLFRISKWRMVTDDAQQFYLKYGFNIIGNNKTSNYIQICEEGVKKTEFYILVSEDVHVLPQLVDVGKNVYYNLIKMNGFIVQIKHKDKIQLRIANGEYIEFQFLLDVVLE
ncbi:uncharacterized protein LOC129920495 [Episyrphus balteatus]|uniref:uncharacterized protein LOC129920495 n=1 Tax=Episyrphus balteatus TaxID=286459 RepID=UPI002485237D|nr:uncharacterized protein LOC129920495 [Episyrphus balteatus]